MVVWRAVADSFAYGNELASPAPFNPRGPSALTASLCAMYRSYNNNSRSLNSQPALATFAWSCRFTHLFSRATLSTDCQKKTAILFHKNITSAWWRLVELYNHVSLCILDFTLLHLIVYWCKIVQLRSLVITEGISSLLSVEIISFILIICS